MGIGIFLSRISGFARDAVLSAFLGSSRFADVWYLGLRTPNVIQNLLGEGTLSAAFIPVYARLLASGREEEARVFAGASLGLLAIVAYGVALAGMALTPLLVPVVYVRLEPSAQLLLIRIIRILLPMTATLAVSACGLAILNTHRRFLVAYTAPVAWNGALLGTALVAGGVLGWAEPGREGDFVTALAWGGVAGGSAQLAILFLSVARAGRFPRPRLSLSAPGVGEALRTFPGAVASRGIANLSGLADSFLAALLSKGAVATMSRAQTLYLLPFALFGMAVAAAELPELSRESGEDPAARRDAMTARVRAAVARGWFLLIPSSVALILLGERLVATLYQRGAFGTDDARVVGIVVACYAIGLSASGASGTLKSGLHALGDTAVPARVAAVRLFAGLLAGGALMVPMDGIRVGPLGLGAAGLALGSAAGAWTEFLLLHRTLRKRIGPCLPASGAVLRILLAALCAGLVARGMADWMAVGGGGIAHLPAAVRIPVETGLALGIMGIGFALLSWRMGVETIMPPRALAFLLRRRT